MTSDDAAAPASSKGLKAFASIAENPGKTPQISDRISAILAPDAVAAIKVRSASVTVAAKGTEEDDAPKRRSTGASRRNKKDVPAIVVDNKAYSEDIKTTHDLAGQVTNILGANVLGALKASCDERKEQERKDQEEKEQQEATKKQKAAQKQKAAAPKYSIKSKLLTPEMEEAMKRAKAGNRASVAPQAKKIVHSDSEEDEDDHSEGDGQVEEETEEQESDRKGRIRPRTRGKPTRSRSHNPKPNRSNSHDHNHHRGDRNNHNNLKPKKPIGERRSKSFDDTNPPKQRPSRSKKDQQKLRHKHQQDFANHADDIGIDLDDGMPEDLDEFDQAMDESSARRTSAPANPARPQRIRKTRRGKSDGSACAAAGGGVSGAAPGRRGRNGRRGGGTRLGNIKQQQVANMTAVDQTKQFREEDWVKEEGDEEEVEEQPASESSEDDFLDAVGDAAAATASLMVKGAGAAVDVVGKGAGSAVNVVGNTAGMATKLATTTGGAVLGGGGAIIGALGTAATTATSAAAKTATSVGGALSMRSGHAQTYLDEYSSDEEEDRPQVRASDGGGGTWGFTGGGFA